jgi:hypothetical protein
MKMDDPIKSIDWNAKVKEALERTDIMALSTIGPDGSWTSPVQYQYSDNLELTFVSLPDTKHVANVLRDPRVSAAIYFPKAFSGPGGGNLGLQIKGTARPTKRNGSSAGWQEFKIIPDEIWCFDSRVSRERHRIDLKSLNLR